MGFSGFRISLKLKLGFWILLFQARDPGFPLYESRDPGFPLYEVRDPGFPLHEARDPGIPLFKARDPGFVILKQNQGEFRDWRCDAEKIIRFKGLHEILGRDYGIEEPCWEISRLR